MTIIAVLNQFGVQTASLIAVLGAAGLAIGLALQGTLSNVAAGVMLLLFRPPSVGQFVEAGGTMGTVKEINLFVTGLATLDNLKVIVPNSAIWGSNITNYSEYPTRRIDIVMGIAYGASIDEAMAIFHKIFEADSRVLADPAPAMFVTNLGASSVDITPVVRSRRPVGAQDRSQQTLQGSARRGRHRDPLPADDRAPGGGIDRFYASANRWRLRKSVTARNSAAAAGPSKRARMKLWIMPSATR